MKPYPEYKPTGLAWLPEIPKHWDWIMLSQIATEQCNKNAERTERNVLSLSYGRIIQKKNLFAGLSPQDYGTYQIISPGNIVMRLTDLQNDHKSLRTGLAEMRGIITSAYTCLKTNHNPAFLHYLLHCYDIRKVFYGLGGGVRQSIGFKDIRGLRFPLPPADEQAQIVRYLDAMTAKINKLIRAKKRQIALLQEQKQAIINQAVTRGLDPDVELKDSGVDWLGPIPKQWEIKTVKQYFKIRKQIAGHEGYDVLSITQDGIKIKDISTNEGQMAMSYAGYQLVRPGDFAMNHMDLLTGYVDRSNYFGVTSPDYRVFELCDNVNCHPDFFLYVFQLYYKRRIFYRYGRGAASVGRWRLPAREFLNFVIPVPPIISQKRIVRFVKNNTQNIDKNILAVESQIKILSEYKNSLIAAVVTGKVDVRNIAVEAVPPEDLAPFDDPNKSEEQDSPVSEESEE